MDLALILPQRLFDETHFSRKNSTGSQSKLEPRTTLIKMPHSKKQMLFRVNFMHLKMYK